jgi:hypothetical protein
MDKPMIRIHDLAINEIIDREMTAAEFKIYQADQQMEAQLKTEIKAKELIRQSVLEKLGITADELKTILG